LGVEDSECGLDRVATGGEHGNFEFIEPGAFSC
jgi:hypothetical protein